MVMIQFQLTPVIKLCDNVFEHVSSHPLLNAILSRVSTYTKADPQIETFTEYLVYDADKILIGRDSKVIHIRRTVKSQELVNTASGAFLFSEIHTVQLVPAAPRTSLYHSRKCTQYTFDYDHTHTPGKVVVKGSEDGIFLCIEGTPSPRAPPVQKKGTVGMSGPGTVGMSETAGMSGMVGTVESEGVKELLLGMVTGLG